MRYLERAFILVAAAGLVSLPAASEEFHLKDGTKLVGTIVAYEKDSFRVETSFGIAIIYKDRIVRIVFPESAAKEAAEKSSGPAAKEGEAAKPAVARREAPPAPPPAPPLEEIVETVTGTRYVNETYRFQMFKPPTWRSYPQLVRPQSALVAALGTPDENTLMLIGRETYGGDLNAYARLGENSLRRLYENYSAQGERRTSVAGLPAVEREFTGMAEGRYWTGLALYFARGRDYYTILGLTAAGETTNFQQALLRKVVDTLAFTE